MPDRAAGEAASPSVTEEKPRLLIVDDDELIQDALGDFFAEDFEVIGALNLNEVKSVLQQLPHPPDYALVDLGLPPTPHQPTEGFAVIGTLQAVAPSCAIVVVSGQDPNRHGQRARALGASDYAEKPCAPQILREKLRQAHRVRLAAKQAFGLVGDSPPMAMLREQIRLITPVSFPVLIEGESGAGKEIVARALHDAARAGKPFMVVNCAAIPEHLVEPTLFGYTKGAFTGAATAAAGYVGDAADGTLFLDEIGDLPQTVQPKLLRVLETGEYRRVGETEPRRCAARVLAASNRIQSPRTGGDGRIRDDLYYRLSVFTINVPPLRRLGDDRFLLLEHYRVVVAEDLSSLPFALAADAQALWAAYHFPGNVRELKNIVARLQVKYGGREVDAESLRHEMCAEEISVSAPGLVESASLSGNADGDDIEALAARLGRKFAAQTLAQLNGDIMATAAHLRTSVAALRRLLGE